ncbi:MAG: Kazal-type serine protease inhibitor family protein [Phycisphaerae bacterium]
MNSSHDRGAANVRPRILTVSAGLLILAVACNNTVRVDVDAPINAGGLPTPCSADGIECDSGDFCLFVEGTCDQPDRTGICTTPPQVCTEIFQPVCGCDSQTYPNECDARAAGVSIDHQGECA